MTKPEVLERIRQMGLIPAVRTGSRDEAMYAAETVFHAGIPIVEITMTTPGAVETIAELARRHPQALVGAGSVLDLETAQRCLAAGAGFLTASGFNPELLAYANRSGVAALPGALTPTEVTTAWQAGGDLIKVLPCAPLGGDSYIKALHTALPQIPLVASGGVNQQTAVNFVLAGAVALGVGTEMIPAEALRRRHAERIRELVTRFLGYIAEARERMAEAAHAAAQRGATGTEKTRA